MGDITGSKAKRAQKQQEEAIAKQQQEEELRLAEEEDIVGRQKAKAKTGGRQSLFATRGDGSSRSNNLGGTQ